MFVFVVKSIFYFCIYIDRYLYMCACADVYAKKTPEKVIYITIKTLAMK